MKYTSFSSQNANSYRWYPIFSFHINQLKRLLCKTSRHSLIQKCDIDPEARHRSRSAASIKKCDIEPEARHRSRSATSCRNFPRIMRKTPVSHLKRSGG
ncbi:hypothetical protein OW493_04345 [Cobetia sp. 14N.309.X.WAT.E.A4]|uniref:hypothetical protein n=1 Tax=Cobetia sp. 14N.309.X.WAT.E.A4 TaxID=2998323 RepID=UPI0025B0142A|nr:hypothetical protein [Cobetia sp. 14N.309.X.WAT.E.A4]MDN2655669.1 hypothetical protein [Cobetia sp. 14N.309.X.WAT.E.A4]